MSLQFDAGAYGNAFEQGENRRRQDRKQIADSLNSIPEALLSYVQQQQKDKQQGITNRRNTLLDAVTIQNAGGDGSKVGDYESGTQTPQSNPIAQASSHPTELAMAPQEDNQLPSTPTNPLFNSPTTTQEPVGRGVIDHWDKTAPAHLHSSTTLGDVFPKGGGDIDAAIKARAAGDSTLWNALPMSKQKMAETDPMYKDALKPKDNLNYSQAKLIVPTIDKNSFDAAYPDGIPREHLAMMSKPQSLSTMNTSTYDTAPADDQRLARSLASGNIRPSDIGYRDRGRIVSLANEYADSQGNSFQSYGGDVKAGMAKNLAYGKMGQNSLSLNTALGHIGDASQAYQDLGNTNEKWLNTPINVLKRQSNDPSIVALDLNLNAVAGEMASTFKSGGATDQEIGHFAKILTSDLTPAQAHAALQKAGALLNSRQNALNSQQSSVMNGTGGERQLLSTHGADVMKQLNQQGGGDIQSAAAAELARRKAARGQR